MDVSERKLDRHYLSCAAQTGVQLQGLLKVALRLVPPRETVESHAEVRQSSRHSLGSPEPAVDLQRRLEVLDRSIEVARALRQNSEVVVGSGSTGEIAETPVRHEAVKEAVARGRDIAEFGVGGTHQLAGLDEKLAVGSGAKHRVGLPGSHERLSEVAASRLDLRQDDQGLRAPILVHVESDELVEPAPRSTVLTQTDVASRQAGVELCDLIALEGVQRRGLRRGRQCLYGVLVAVRPQVDPTHLQRRKGRGARA